MSILIKHIGDNIMTEIEFVGLCGKYTIYPEIALENEALKEALLRRDDKLVEKILLEDF
jgi:hypothetical protein